MNQLVNTMENHFLCPSQLFSRLSHREVAKGLIFLGIAGLVFFFCTDSMAGTTGVEFKGAWDKVVALIDGYGGKMIAGVALATALLGSVLRFNPYVVFGALGVGITASVGTSIIGSTVTAII